MMYILCIIYHNNCIYLFIKKYIVSFFEIRSIVVDLYIDFNFKFQIDNFRQNFLIFLEIIQKRVFTIVLHNINNIIVFFIF